MPIPWGDHLDMARCVEVLGEYDLRGAITAMGRCLFHLQRDLLLENLKEQLPNKQLLSFANEAPKALKCKQFCKLSHSSDPQNPSCN